jgi:hypothetical protein
MVRASTNVSEPGGPPPRSGFEGAMPTALRGHVETHTSMATQSSGHGTPWAACGAVIEKSVIQSRLPDVLNTNMSAVIEQISIGIHKWHAWALVPVRRRLVEVVAG